ncbi:hypothetical protein Sa4125_07950 [Aureimonas sp. SA4125]|uniref:hypothetical protein n=1 Tax=Aureimonas sp. SA4125 TaxID=2826993 RepID=UPI001CC78C5E|nr:hypothetical protein [Aureimonas sp. SA4125]BDA83253.1 hypothetical protein Sa4125_07950 [Aureimonas sp. SA4125]
MRSRLLILVGLVSGLGACTPRMPTIDLSGTSLPRFDMFRSQNDKSSPATTPYPLSRTELAIIKSEFSAAFKDGRTVQFGPVTARRRATGNLVVCGLVSIQKPDGTRSGMTLFDGVGSFETLDGTLTFTPQRLAGGNAKQIDVYGDCRDAGAL